MSVYIGLPLKTIQKLQLSSVQQHMQFWVHHGLSMLHHCCESCIDFVSFWVWFKVLVINFKTFFGSRAGGLQGYLSLRGSANSTRTDRLGTHSSSLLLKVAIQWDLGSTPLGSCPSFGTPSPMSSIASYMLGFPEAVKIWLFSQTLENFFWMCGKGLCLWYWTIILLAFMLFIVFVFLLFYCYLWVVM